MYFYATNKPYRSIYVSQHVFYAYSDNLLGKGVNETESM